MISKITKAYTRTYSDSGQVKSTVEWIDHHGKAGRTEGEATGWHMQALLARAEYEGVKITTETW
jgi:hypothetical protein